MMSRWSLRGQNRGASLIAVVVALIFVTIIGAIIMTITQTNIQMRAAETYSKRNFYSAEELMNELSAGLNESAAVAMQQAYIDVLLDYRDIVMSSGSLQEEFQQAYMTELEKIFWDGVSPRMIQHDPLEPSVTQFVLGNYQKSVVYDGWWNACNHSSYSVVGDFISSDEGKCLLTTDDESTYTLDYLEGVFTLQNVKISYVDSIGYETTITTDIAFHTPELNPDDGSQIRNFMKYALIADDQITIAGSGVEVIGSAYAGYNGINTNHSTTSFVGSNIVTRGDIRLEPGSHMTIGNSATRTWAENIVTASDVGSDPSTLTLNGNCYVADDLTLNGKNTTVNLNGNFYGYNFKEDYTGAASADRADFSSSIVINGEGSRLDMTGLEYLYLAGRTYISRGGAGSVNTDIPMGESLAVRTNQLAYNVPVSYVEFADPTSPIATGFAVDTNGLRQYAASVGLTEAQVQNRLNTTSPIATYRYIDNGHAAYRYYLNFKDEQSANDFFYDYWTANSTKLGAYGAGFADAIVISDTLNYTLSGDLMVRNTTSGLNSGFTETRTNIVINDWQAANPTAGTPAGMYHTFSDRIAINYKALQMYLEDFHSSVNSSNVRFKDAFGNIDKSMTPLTWNLIDMQKLDDDNVSIDMGTVGTDHLVVIDNKSGAEYTTTINDKGLIIATGDVRVMGNFTGTIIAGGKISFSSISSARVSADENLVSEIFKNDAALGSSSVFTKYFVDNGTVADGVIGAVQLGNYVSYENWTRTEK